MTNGNKNHRNELWFQPWTEFYSLNGIPLIVLFLIVLLRYTLYKCHSFPSLFPSIYYSTRDVVCGFVFVFVFEYSIYFENTLVVWIISLSFSFFFSNRLNHLCHVKVFPIKNEFIWFVSLYFLLSSYILVIVFWSATFSFSYSVWFHYETNITYIQVWITQYLQFFFMQINSVNVNFHVGERKR